MASGRRVAGIIRALANAKGFARVLQHSFLVPGLTYGSETMIWREKEKSMIRAVQMDNLRGLLGIGRSDKFLNAWIKELCGVMKCVDKWIDVGVF